MTTTLGSRMNLMQRIAIAGAALFATGGVLQAATSDVLEEIVVTAQKREQNVQNVPIAITAFTGGGTAAERPR